MVSTMIIRNKLRILSVSRELMDELYSRGLWYKYLELKKIRVFRLGNILDLCPRESLPIDRGSKF